ncbi:MAG: adenylate/guanylate cyclase domain-containing protein [Myxococcota bacterium]
MALLRWLGKSGFRLPMLVAIGVFLFHVIGELRLLRGGSPGFLQMLELTMLDVKFRYRGPRPPEEWKVAVVAADEKAIQELGRLPWARSVHGKLVDRLTALGASAIAFDMTFEDSAASTLPSDFGDAVKAAREQLRTTDGALAEAGAVVGRDKSPLKKKLEPLLERAENASKQAENVLVGAEAAIPVSEDQLFADALRRSQRGVVGILAYSHLEANAVAPAVLDASMRRIASSTITELLAERHGGYTILPNAAEAFETALYRRFFGVQAPDPVVAAGTEHFGTINAFPDADGVYRRVPLIAAIKGRGVLVPTLALKAVSVASGQPIEVIAAEDDPTPEAVRVGKRVTEVELASTTALDWYGEFHPSQMPIFSAADVLAGRIPAEKLKDKIVFIAATAVGTYDQRVTPFGSSVPGVSVHATLAQNLLDGRHYLRPRYVIGIELCVFLLIGLIGGLVMSRMGPLGQLFVAVGMSVVWALVDRYVLFEHGLIVYTVLPLVQIGLTLVTVASWRFLIEERERRKTKQAFSRYLAPAVMQQVLDHPEEYLKLGGRRCEATVLFSDIRGFTTISEALSPEELGHLLNKYMTPMTDLVFASGGTLDKYIGDAVMAFWGAPITQADHALRACKTALEMIAKVEALNVEFEREKLPRIAIGVGISSGPMTIGNMGSLDHFSYTALGDRVNLGSRLEGQTKDYGVSIIVSDATYALVKDQAACRELGSIRVKGKLEPVRIFELIAIGKLSPEEQAFVDGFHAALAAFRERRFPEAGELFQKANALAGPDGDKTSLDYADLCEEYAVHPPGPTWDGVRVATSK